MDTADYSKAGLINFLTTAVEHGLLNANTAAGWTAACSRILEDVADTDDVRKIDVPTAIKRYHNKHPGELKGNSLLEYQRRLTRALADFIQYTEEPTSYKGRGRPPSADGGPKSSKSRAKADAKKPLPLGEALAPKSGSYATSVYAFTQPAAGTGLTLDFPMRPDFLAQIVVPRDMKAHEARRLSAFIMTLAMDNIPAGETS